MRNADFTLGLLPANSFLKLYVLSKPTIRYMKTYSTLLLIALFLFSGCYGDTDLKPDTTIEPVTIEMTTNYGIITLKLYNETPLHRDNFMNLIQEGYYDSLQFHRVIEHFVIQGGDPNSKRANLADTIGSGGLPYTIPAEFHPDVFHKRGALGAARGDHPQRASGSTQFYIVQGEVVSDSMMIVAQTRINNWLARHFARNDHEFKSLQDSIQYYSETGNDARYRAASARFQAIIDDYDRFERYEIPDDHRQYYQTIGGTPHLDQNYTVFGEVISGMDIVDAIAAVETNSMDRPMNEVRILKMRMIENDN